VRLASTRLGRVWLLRPTAHGVSLASTSLGQVCICLRPVSAAVEYNQWITLGLASVAGKDREAHRLIVSQRQKDMGKDRGRQETVLQNEESILNAQSPVMQYIMSDEDPDALLSCPDEPWHACNAHVGLHSCSPACTNDISNG
jgi:hypothetical protein